MKYFVHIRLILFLLVAFLVAGLLFTQAQESMQRWQNFDFSKSALKATDIASLPLQELKLVRGVVFGRHGRIFKDAEIRTYLESQAWYKPNMNFQNSMLNTTERRNLDLIRDAEAARHDTVQPGDMRFWRTRSLTAKKLGKHSGAEWLVLSSEIEA